MGALVREGPRGPRSVAVACLRHRDRVLGSRECRGAGPPHGRGSNRAELPTPPAEATVTETSTAWGGGSWLAGVEHPVPFHSERSWAPPSRGAPRRPSIARSREGLEPPR